MRNREVSVTLVRHVPLVKEPYNQITQLKGAALVSVGQHNFRTGEILNDVQADELCLSYPNTTVNMVKA
jgi:hypothetical protein